MVCPICLSTQASTRELTAAIDKHRCSCLICGTFDFIMEPALLAFQKELPADAEERAYLSHRVRQMTLAQEHPLVPQDLIGRAREKPELPSPAAQLDNLVLHLGRTLRFPGRFATLSPDQWSPIIGARDIGGATSVANWAAQADLVEVEANRSLALTFDGWQRYDDLTRSRSASRRAFMAMPFNNELVDLAYRQFQISVEHTGFRLQRVDEEPRAGLIDDQIRVGILVARFVVADLTSGSNGVYWEAGFAEGLGKPVIYTCEEAFFNEKRTHFDTNHRQTIVWRQDNIEAASGKLKAAIRATLPDEAFLEDRPTGK